MNNLSGPCMLMHMVYSVAVSGATGYAGGEVLRLLAGNPNFSVTTVCGHSTVGRLLGEEQPHLRAYSDMTIADSSAATLAGHDVVFLALPHGQSGAIAAELEELSPETLIIDLAADHRLIDPEAWKSYYGSEHPGTWTYGLPELMLADLGSAQHTTQRTQLTGAARIAVPGCNVTAVTLGVQPLVHAGLIDHTRLTAVLANGVSGAGKALKPHLLASEILGGASPYAVGGTHRHIPEIEQNLALASGEDPLAGTARITFTPTLVPMSRGILATVSAPLAPGVAAAQAQEKISAAFASAYDSEPFVTVLPQGQWPNTSATVGSNQAHLQWALDARTQAVTVCAAIDNLVRGTAGQAVQSAHIALGLEETSHLPHEGVTP